MPTFACPRCGSPVSFRRSFNIGNKPFCARCGWNLARAEAALAAKSSLFTLLPVVVLAAGALIVFAGGFSRNLRNPSFLIFLVVLPLFMLIPIVGYFSTKKAIAAAKFSVNPDLALAQPPLDPQLQMLQSLPRPRRVKFRPGRNLAAVTIVFAAIGILNAIIFLAVSRTPFHNKPDSFAPFIPLFFVMIVFAAIFLVPFFRDKRNLPLLRDGELAFARVVAQRTIQQGKSSYSSIDYEFKTNTGFQIRSTARDLTNSVFEDMTIPVFYDPSNPDKNITPCATYLKVSTDPL